MALDFEKIEAAIDYSFGDRSLLALALTHPSYSGEMKRPRIESNQRLEFLGDSVLELTVSDYLYKTHPDVEEGELTRMRSSLVFEDALCLCAGRIGLGGMLLLGKGEEMSGGREKPSILSDAFEALIGAIYIDGGIGKASDFIHRNVTDCIGELSLLKDAKSAIQEYVQKTNGSTFFYETKCSHADGSESFVSTLFINGEAVSSGKGRSKKAAEQDAAGKAVRIFCVK